MFDLLYSRIVRPCQMYCQYLVFFFQPNPSGLKASKASWKRIKATDDITVLSRTLSVAFCPFHKSWNTSCLGMRERAFILLFESLGLKQRGKNFLYWHLLSLITFVTVISGTPVVDNFSLSFENRCDGATSLTSWTSSVMVLITEAGKSNLAWCFK